MRNLTGLLGSGSIALGIMAAAPSTASADVVDDIIKRGDLPSREFVHASSDVTRIVALALYQLHLEKLLAVERDRVDRIPPPFALGA